MTPRPLAAFAVLLAAASAHAQFELPGGKKTLARNFADVGELSATVEPPTAAPGQTVKVKVTVTPKGDAWTYPVRPADPGQSSKNKIPLPPNGDLIFVEPPADPPGAKTKPSDLDPAKTVQYYPAPTTWELAAVVSPKAAAGKKTVPLTGTSVQVCNDDNCFNSPIDPPAVTLEVAGTAVPVEEKYRAKVDEALNPPARPTPPPPAAEPPAEARHGVQKKDAVPAAEYARGLAGVRERIVLSDTQKVTNTGLVPFLLTAAAWGLVSLVTPCVFPMIPITVSIFLKQSHDSTAEALKLAVVYCLTIILVLGVSAIALLKVFVDLSVSPGMNLFMGGLFVFFALSLFGMYDIALPQGLLRFTQAKQGKGGVVGTVFGALAFTIVGFTCVAPFLGGFAGMAASGNFNTLELVLGGLAFSTAFASPFFVLALFPSLLKKLPRSGGWLDSVKVVMGFLELAAALVFFRTAELRLWQPTQYFTYDLVLAGWVATAAACGLYLLNVYRLPHDEDRPNIGVLRLVFAVLFLGLAVYLAPGMLKTADGKPQRPGGAVFAWVDAFMLPESGGELPFGSDLPAALERARKGGRPVFVDFTGTTCKNCKLNEANVFPRPAIRDLLLQYELVQLYTDDVPGDFYLSPPPTAARAREGEENRRFKEALFSQQLPEYVILRPDGDKVRVVGVYDEGAINHPERFAEFLRKPLAK
jgi:thiol:disulfide interchange protein DsbD